MIRTIEKIEQSMIINEGGLQMKQPLPSSTIKNIDPFVPAPALITEPSE